MESFINNNGYSESLNTYNLSLKQEKADTSSKQLCQYNSTSEDTVSNHLYSQQMSHKYSKMSDFPENSGDHQVT